MPKATDRLTDAEHAQVLAIAKKYTIKGAVRVLDPLARSTIKNIVSDAGNEKSWTLKVLVPLRAALARIEAKKSGRARDAIEAQAKIAEMQAAIDALVFGDGPCDSESDE